MKQKLNFTQPEFLLCEIPIKDGTFNDDRIWIYHRLSLSLIEFILVDDFIDFQFHGIQERFEYGGGNYLGVFAQDYCVQTNNDPSKVLQKSWQYLKIILSG